MKNKKGNPPNHDLHTYTNKHIYIARDTWMPSLENWGGGLKIFCVCMCVWSVHLRGNGAICITVCMY